METLKKKIIYVIREKCPHIWTIHMFMNHINIILPDGVQDFKHIKNSITTVVKDSYPCRDRDILFVLQSGSLESDLKIYKSEGLSLV
jgi:hypothetical protein